jgi:hypothetical protein
MPRDWPHFATDPPSVEHEAPPSRGLLVPRATPQRQTTCIGCGEPVQAVIKQGVSSGVRRRTRHVEPVAELALRCRFDGGPDLDDEALEPYPGDVA